MPESVRPPVTEGDSSKHETVERSFGMQPVAITEHGLRVPKFGLGTWQLDDDEAREMTAQALELGVRHIDTAQMYENEAGVGRGLDEAGVDRRDVFVTTKVSNENHEPGDLAASVEASLERLGTEYVDLLLIHWPVEEDRLAATLDTLAQVHAAGSAKHIGLSNFTRAQLDEFAGNAPVEVLQVECHPYLQQAELRRWCVDHGWIFTAYSPLAQGDVLDDDTLRDIAEAHDTSATAVSLAWLMAQPSVIVIPRTTDAGHLRDNWSSLEVELSTDELARIDDLDEGRRLVDPDFAPW